MLAMLVLLQVISEAGRPLSALRTEVEPYASSGEVNLKVADQAAAVRRVEASFTDGELDRQDGLTVSWPDRWFNIRASNTEPVLRLNVEGPDQAAVTDLVQRVRQIVGA
jgi:phosphomannomutase